MENGYEPQHKVGFLILSFGPKWRGTGDADANIDARAAPSNMRHAFSLSLREKFEGLGCPKHHDALFPEMKLARMHLMQAGRGTPATTG